MNFLIKKYWDNVYKMNTEKFGWRPVHDGIEKVADIDYVGDGDKYHLLDLYIPQGEGKLPCIVNIHGGGWVYGEKVNEYAFHGSRLATQGFVVVNPNYRLAPKNPHPAQLEDIFAVLHWVAENAEKYRIDTNNIFLEGDSAGAQLSALTACIVTNPELAKEYNFTAPFEIRALGLCCGAYDFEAMLSKKDFELWQNKQVLGAFMGKKNPKKSKSYKNVLVYNYITKDFPPSFLLAVGKDTYCPDTLKMHELLNGAGVHNELLHFPETEDLWHCFHLDNDRPEQSEMVLTQKAAFYKGQMC